MRVLYAIAGTIVACVAILVTYQIIRVQIDKRAAARRAQTEKDIANAEDPLTRRDQFITNQAEQTYSTIDRLNSAVARHETNEMIDSDDGNRETYQDSDQQEEDFAEDELYDQNDDNNIVSTKEDIDDELAKLGEFDELIFERCEETNQNTNTTK